MARSLFLLIFSVLVIGATNAQDKLTGRIYENKTRVSLAGIRIEDLKSHATAVSDSTGRFSIKSNIGDFVSFSGFAYQTDTVYLNTLKFTEIFLSPKQNMLNEVKITTPQIKTGSLAAPVEKGPLNSKAVVYQTDGKLDPNTGNLNYVGGVKVKVFDWDKDAKKKQRDDKVAVKEEKALAIYNLFQPKNLQNYVPLKGVEMDNFIILYTPDVETFYGSGFNLAVYLNTCYDKFLQMPVGERQSPTAFRLTLKADTSKKP
jgi:hypothetical protein